MGGQGGFSSTQRPAQSCWTLAAPGSVFPAALQRAAKALKKADVEAPHLDEYSWHGNRHGRWRWFSGTLTLPRGTSRPLWNGWYHRGKAL